MNTLLVFFAVPLAIIILSAIFETLIYSPIKVAGIFFSIFIVIAFALGGTAEQILAAIIYSILSFFSAFIMHVIQQRRICESRIEPQVSHENCCIDNYQDISNSISGSSNYSESPLISNTSNTIVENNSRCRKYR